MSPLETLVQIPTRYPIYIPVGDLIEELLADLERDDNDDTHSR